MFALKQIAGFKPTTLTPPPLLGARETGSSSRYTLRNPINLHTTTRLHSAQQIARVSKGWLPGKGIELAVLGFKHLRPIREATIQVETY